MKQHTFFLFLLGILLSSQLFAIDIFVSPKGNDRWEGTVAKPLASLTGARDKVRALRKLGKINGPVNIYVANGSYFMNGPLLLTEEDSGTSNAPVRYIAAANANPVFYAGTPVTGFRLAAPDLWQAHIPESDRYKWHFEQLYVNGKNVPRAKSPQSDFFQPANVTEVVINQGPEKRADLAAQKISLRPEQLAWFKTLSAADLEDAVLTFYHKWDNTRKKIWKFSAADSAVYTYGQGMKPWNKLDSNTIFTVENIRAGLDTPGEWYLDKEGMLSYKPRKGETIAGIKCIAPVYDRFIVIRGRSDKPVTNIVFENLAFKVAGYKMPEKGNEAMQAAASVEAAVMIDHAAGIQFLNCEIANTGNNGIWFRDNCKDSRIEHCYLHDLGAGGVKIGPIKPGKQEELTHHIKVNNNIVQNGGRIFPCATGIAIFNASDNALTHNEISDFYYSGISAGWIWGYGNSVSKRNTIEYNHIHHLGWGLLSDMGAVYTLAPSEGSTVSNNVIHHVYSRFYGGWGLYTDEGSTGITFENNLVYACKSGAFHQHYGKENIIRNNLFVNQIRTQLEASRIEPHTSFRFTNNIISYTQGRLAGIRWDKVNFVSDSNCYWFQPVNKILVGDMDFAAWQASGKDVHSIIADPALRDPAGYDFTPTSKTVIAAIGFKPFDYSKAGVYGDKAWKKRAELDPSVMAAYDYEVAELEKRQLKDFH